MKLVYTSRFERAYRKLSAAGQKAVDEALHVFVEDLFAPALRNHALQGKLKGIRAIKAGYDLRLLYTEEDGHTIVFFIAVGTHDQVY